AEDVRSLLGAFSLDALDRVTRALAASSTAEMLALVDDLERNGHNLQHFARELARYFRNLVVARIGDPRLIAASTEQREKLRSIAAGFSEDDLTRYLALSLALFQDLQASLQPRFHLELGLIRLVHAGRLVAIEEAIAGLAAAPKTASTAAARGPEPTLFELDRAKKTTRPEPTLSDGANALAPALAPGPVAVPSADLDWKLRLPAVLLELGLQFTADAVEHSTLAASAGELHFTTPKEFLLAMKPDDLNQAVRRLIGRTLKVRVTAGNGADAAPAAAAPQPVADDVTRRALDHAEVRRFQELFGGQVRTVRNLKE
ncbi:MAG: DNA polymerase III subunit gamma/tau, partial [Bryobacteraceae bacterium]